jgi:hypothetical protein
MDIEIYIYETIDVRGPLDIRVSQKVKEILKKSHLL